MRGTYRFSQGGVLLGQSPNLITDEGRRQIMRFLAGEANSIGGSIAVGTGQRAPATSDQRLTYEFDRSTIYLISPDYTNRRIIFKTTLDVLTVGTIYEVGLYSTTYAPAGTRSLANFERTNESWSVETYASGNQRLGFEALRLAPSTGATLTAELPSVSLDLSEYANNDQFSLAFYCLNDNTSSVRIRLRASDTSNYFEYVHYNPTAGYNVVSFAKSAMTKVGNLSFSVIDSLEVAASAKTSGAAPVDFDGIRIQSTNPDSDDVLVSRSVLSTPIVKTDIAPLDVEYELEVSL